MGTADAAPLATAFAASWRRHRLDCAATVMVFAAAALAAGRVWRFPFDDEVFTMVPHLPDTAHGSLWDLVRFYLIGGDIHPPSTFLFFSRLYRLGVGEIALHLISLAMTALALVLWQLLALAMLAEHQAAPAGVAARIIAILMFGLSPLAIGEGDAIRWYPQFALCVALFTTFYLAGPGSVRLAASVPLGAATSINLIAPLVILPFALYRYRLERACRRRFDAAFWMLYAVFAAVGLYAAVSIAALQGATIQSNVFGHGSLRALATDGLGLFGGNALGLGEAWLVAPFASLTLIAAVSLIDRRRLAAPVHFPLMLLGMAIPAAVAGFDESRAFLYLAPIVAAVVTIFLSRLAEAGRIRRTALLAAVAVLPGIAGIGELRTGAHPFKRSAAVPLGELIDFITAHEDGDVLVVSTDPVVLWELRKRDLPGLCASYFLNEAACLENPQRFRSVFVVSGYSEASLRHRFMELFAVKLAELTAGREKRASLRVGRDEDAMLKTWLTGVPLDEFILTVDFYR